DAIEREGIRRAREAIAQADHILVMQDDREPVGDESGAHVGSFPAHNPRTWIRNKIDLTGAAPGKTETDGGPVLRLSLKTGAGVDALKLHLKECAGYRGGEEQVFIARRRHLEALDRGQVGIERGLDLLDVGQAELLAEELRIAQQALSEITGTFTNEDLLGRIFAGFCIGK
ncbi:MAG: tRNA uridine-5-carboxymethylaminomethyl(34) synthesis GTPase MnmE, partial [Methylococcaceae bacterium]|nr:tRNA uridine-5-carboxymethylaminomethyl(34) synthesis GTPase MnmE [Methylococcaceae bacterium]